MGPPRRRAQHHPAPLDFKARPRQRAAHRRSEAARRAILEAADDLVAERGFAAVTIEGIAARAGVGKQTIYRWWRSKTEVLIDAFVEDAGDELALPDTGRIEDDLKALLERLARFLTTADAGAVFKALIGQALHDPLVAAQLRERYLVARRAAERAVLARAIDRGQLPAGLDLDAALDELLGPIAYRALVTGDRVDPDFTDGLVNHVLARIAREDSIRTTSERPSQS